ncbi:hypothetical protein DL98DRAFT_588397 [Cadophora sp. DSE1049]|nr:hypothetical protein DL98DRAFT_588397 [Cadophora sp. DSE1049]
MNSDIRAMPNHLETVHFETSKRVLAQLINEGLASGTFVTTNSKTWLTLSSPSSLPGAQEQREVKVRIRPDAAAFLSAGRWQQVIRPEHLHQPIRLEVTANGDKNPWEELDPRSIFGFVYPWLQHIDHLERKATVVKELRNSTANQEKRLEIASTLKEPTLDSSYIEWERSLIWGHPTHPVRRSLGAVPPLRPVEPGIGSF